MSPSDMRVVAIVTPKLLDKLIKCLDDPSERIRHVALQLVRQPVIEAVLVAALNPQREPPAL